MMHERPHATVVAENTGTPAIAAAGLWKTYPGGAVPAVEDLSLDVGPGEVLALLGPSGCGKTTALRLLAGLERPDAGTVAIDGRTIVGPGVWTPPEKRSVGLVFQDYALFPHLTVRGNVAYGLNRLSRADRRARIEQVLSMTGLAPYTKRYPHELSGGQQQRVAIARAIAPRPAVLLLDEPFSNLDVSLREQVRSEVLGILRAAGASVVLVTHDQDEAFVAAARIAVMSNGRVHQVGTPEELYLRPRTRFVARFVGIANFLHADVRGHTAITELGAFELAGEGGTSDVMLRPEQIEISDGGLPATVIAREFHGHDWLYVLKTTSGAELRTISPSTVPLDVGSMVHVQSRVGTVPAFAADDAAADVGVV
jgi:iron(III) transport system ATP-binding protein